MKTDSLRLKQQDKKPRQSAGFVLFVKNFRKPSDNFYGYPILKIRYFHTREHAKRYAEKDSSGEILKWKSFVPEKLFANVYETGCRYEIQEIFYED